MQILAGFDPGNAYLCENSVNAEVTSVNINRSVEKGMDGHRWARHHIPPCHRLTSIEDIQGWQTRSIPV